MLQLLFGDNDFLKKLRVGELVKDFSGEVERYDGEELETGDLRNLLRGQTLFSADRLVIVSDLSLSPAWADLPEIAREADVEVILLENKLDKRTKTYKWLVKQAKCEEFKSFSEYDGQKVVGWCQAWAKKEHGLVLERKYAQMLVSRLGHDQLRLDKFLEQLSLAEKIDERLIDALVPLPKSESVFELMEATLEERRGDVKNIINYLETTSGPEGAYMTLGLVVSQLIILNALVLGGSQAQIAKDVGAHPFVVQKLAPHARKLTIDDVKKLNQALGEADLKVKTTTASPWLLLETALFR